MAAVVRTVLVQAGVVLGAWAAGVALSVMKGDGEGLADALGNLSAPYVIVAVAAGLTTRRAWWGALLGIAASVSMVAGFYWAWGAVLGHEISPSALSVWCVAGVLSGALFGAAGWVAARRPSLRYVIPALLLLEPFASRVTIITGRFGMGSAEIDRTRLEAYGIEVMIGILVLFVVRDQLRRMRQAHSAV